MAKELDKKQKKSVSGGKDGVSHFVPIYDQCNKNISKKKRCRGEAGIYESKEKEAGPMKIMDWFFNKNFDDLR